MTSLYPKTLAGIFRRIAVAWRKRDGYRAKIRFLLHSWKFAQHGKSCSIGKNVRITGDVKIHLGDRVAIRDNVVISGNGILRIGDRTAINEGTIICAMESVTIGSDCMLAPRCYILDVDHSIKDLELPMSKQGYDISPVSIGNDVWLGAYSIISRGVEIDDGAVVAGHAFVRKNVENRQIVGGVPARPIGKRGE